MTTPPRRHGLDTEGDAAKIVGGWSRGESAFLMAVFAKENILNGRTFTLGGDKA